MQHEKLEIRQDSLQTAITSSHVLLGRDWSIAMLASYTDRCVEGLAGEHHVWTEVQVGSGMPPPPLLHARRCVST